MDHANREPLDPMRAAVLMARVAKEELDLSIDPHDILRMFERRWQTLSNLAHSIHRPIPGQYEAQASQARPR